MKVTSPSDEHLSSLDPKKVLLGLQLCFSGNRLVSFKYDGGFSIVFQRDGASLLPSESRLTIKSPFQVIGDSQVMHVLATDLATRKTSERTVDCVRAFSLMSLVHETVSDIKLSSGDMVLQFASGGSISVAGLGQDWDFSWHASIPDLQSMDSEHVSIDCDEEGELYCSWTARFNEHFELTTT